MLLRQPKDLGQPLNSSYGLKYIWLNLSIIGIHPPPAKVHLFWRCLYFLYAVVIIFMAGFCLPASMFANLVFVETWKEVIGNLSYSINITSSTLKQSAILFNRKRFFKANHYLRQLDERCEAHAQDRMIVLNGIRYCHVIYRGYICFYIFCAFGITYVGWSNHQLIYNAWFPVISKDPKTNYILAFIYQNLSQVFLVFQSGTSDMYPLCYTSLMIAHLQALAERIKRMGTDKQLSQEQNIQELRNCIQDHKNIHHYFDCIRPVISTTLFVQFFITAFVLCLTAINLIAFNRDFMEKLFSIVYLVAIVVQIFPACLCVNILMEETSKLTTAMYSCNWIDQNRTFKRMLIIFMQRSQKQNVINAGDLAPVTLQTFVAIIKFSFSMFTILSQMKIAE